MDEKAFREFLQANQDRVFSYAWYFLRHREDAEDVTQEAFVRLWRQCPATDDTGRQAWLTRVVHNLCVDADRRRKVRHNWARPAAEGELERYPDRRESTVDPQSRLETEQEQARRRDAVEQALEGLTPDARGVVLLHYWRGLSLRDIAAALGQNENTVKVRIHRARRTLRGWLDGLGAAEVGS